MNIYVMRVTRTFEISTSIVVTAENEEEAKEKGLNEAIESFSEDNVKIEIKDGDLWDITDVDWDTVDDLRLEEENV